MSADERQAPEALRLRCRFVIISTSHHHGMAKSLPTAVKRIAQKLFEQILVGLEPFGVEVVGSSPDEDCNEGEVCVEWGLAPCRPLLRGSHHQRGSVRVELSVDGVWTLSIAFQPGDNKTRYQLLATLPKYLLETRITTAELQEGVRRGARGANQLLTEELGGSKKKEEDEMGGVRALVDQGAEQAKRAARLLPLIGDSDGGSPSVAADAAPSERSESAQGATTPSVETTETKELSTPPKPLYLQPSKFAVAKVQKLQTALCEALLAAQDGDAPASTNEVLFAMTTLHPELMAVKDGRDRPSARENLRMYEALAALARRGLVVKSGSTARTIRWAVVVPEKEAEPADLLIEGLRELKEKAAKLLEVEAQRCVLERRASSLRQELEDVQVQICDRRIMLDTPENKELLARCNAITEIWGDVATPK